MTELKKNQKSGPKNTAAAAAAAAETKAEDIELRVESVDVKRQQQQQLQNDPPEAPQKAAAAAAVPKEEKKPSAAAVESKKKSWTAATADWVIRDKIEGFEETNPNAAALLSFVREMSGSEGYRDINMVWLKASKDDQYDKLADDKTFERHWSYHMTATAAAEVRSALVEAGLRAQSALLAVIRDEQARTHLCGLIAARYVLFRAGKQSHAGTRANAAYTYAQEAAHLKWFIKWSKGYS